MNPASTPYPWPWRAPDAVVTGQAGREMAPGPRTVGIPGLDLEHAGWTRPVRVEGGGEQR